MYLAMLTLVVQHMIECVLVLEVLRISREVGGDRLRGTEKWFGISMVV